MIRKVNDVIILRATASLQWNVGAWGLLYWGRE
jgi:hypothetical protein